MKISWFIAFLLVFSTSCISVMADHTIRTQTESFPAGDVTAALLETGAGTLTVTGMPGLSAIEVTAEFKCRDSSAAKAQDILDNLRLTMEVRGNTFHLKSEHLRDWNWGDSGWIDITIKMPKQIDLEVDDGSGAIAISGMGRNIRIEDGSGEIELTDIDGSIHIEDGSGEIRIRNAQRDVEINDGSGSIDVRYVGGNVRISDGSGSIDVDDVRGDLIIPSDGSGSLHYARVTGKVDVPKRRR